MKKDKTKRLALSAMFLALGIVLPILTGQIPQIGTMLLPMHIPVFLCAFICGSSYAVPMAFLLPLFRTAVFGFPVFYPDSIAIAFEMSSYALVSGLIYKHRVNKNAADVYCALICAMVVGRIVRISAQLVLLSITGTPFTFVALLTGIVLRGIPGIIIQLTLIPLIIFICNKNALKEKNNI